MAGLVLHNYFRSSTSIRVRVALNLKGLDYAYVAHHLRRGEHRGDAYRAINPQALVPALELADGTVLTQSLAIIEYLDEVFPAAAVAAERTAGAGAGARHRAGHRLRDPSAQQSARAQRSAARFGADDAAVSAWIHHWVGETFVPLEAMLAGDSATGTFCHGEQPGMADACLYAQVITNRRFDVDMAPYPTIARIFAAAARLPAFDKAAPENQPDAE